MTPGLRSGTIILFLAVVFVSAQLIPDPPTAVKNDHLPKKRAIFSNRPVQGKPKFGFFGTIFHLILEQINDTKSAYNQVSDLVNNQFTDDNNLQPKQPESADSSNNGTTETPKISRTEFLKILDRNLKGLRRLRDLEWREAWKDTRANIMAYKNEAFNGKGRGS